MESREYIGNEPSLPGLPTSVWLANAPQTTYPRLAGDVTADVAVVGAGLVGVLTAHLLAQRGRSVVLLERRRVCGNASGHTTAKATIHHGPLYAKLRHAHGELGALRYALANLRGLNLIAEACAETGCRFRRLPSYVYVESAEERGEMRAEAEVMAHLGLPASYVEDAGVPFPLAAAVRLEHQGQFDPVRLAAGLLERAGDAVRVYEETAVTAVEDGEPCVVSAETGTVRAREVVLASQFPAVDTAAFFARLFPHTSTAVAARVADELPDGTFYCEQPEHGIRTYGDDRRQIVVSGAPHPTGARGDDRERYREVLEWTQRHFGVEEVTYHWSTEDFDTPDQVPYVGRSPFTQHVSLATGFGGWGMTNAAASALLLANLLTGHRDPDAAIFDASRVPASGVTEMLAHGAGTAEAFTVGRFREVEEREPASLGVGEGAVVSRGGRTTAACRDDAGRLFELDPVCRHLGCQVTWNEAEKTWDCPCHGSRYAADGTELYAPTRSPLLQAGRG